MNKINRFIFSGVLIISILGCSGNNSAAVSDGQDSVVSISGVVIGAGYSLETPGGNFVEFNGGKVSVPLAAPKDGERQVLALLNENGDPVLIRLRSSLDDNTLLDWDSTALFFVLNHPDFGLLGFTDKQLHELSNIISKSDKFSEIKNLLIGEYEKKSSCMLSYSCSPYAAYVAAQLIGELDFSGIEK